MVARARQIMKEEELESAETLGPHIKDWNLGHALEESPNQQMLAKNQAGNTNNGSPAS